MLENIKSLKASAQFAERKEIKYSAQGNVAYLPAVNIRKITKEGIEDLEGGKVLRGTTILISLPKIKTLKHVLLLSPSAELVEVAEVSMSTIIEENSEEQIIIRAKIQKIINNIHDIKYFAKMVAAY